MIFAQKPPMGWNAWNYFGYADINEQVVRETADAMVEKGFRDAGYNIVQVDDAWLLQKRDENGDHLFHGMYFLSHSYGSIPDVRDIDGVLRRRSLLTVAIIRFVCINVKHKMNIISQHKGILCILL